MFHQPLRQTEGLLGSLLELMGIDLPIPHHTTISRRAARLTPVLRTALPNGPVTLGIDSTGLKVYGVGELHRDKHGTLKAYPRRPPACPKAAWPAGRGCHRRCCPQPHDRCWTPEIRPHRVNQEGG